MNFEYREFVIECSALNGGAGYSARVVVSYLPLDATKSPEFKSDLPGAFSTALQAIYFARNVGELWCDGKMLGCRE